MTLEAFFRQVPKAAAAFSGGTDSALLLWAAKRYGCDVRAYYVKTPFQPRFEYEDACRLALEKAGKNGVICALGSLYMVGEITRAFEKNR